ncbi:RES domain-containing protein [Legionella sp. CNM-4043-24]|uniref:RES domain-containing protein n=1 Tax=Legionella sp. CNM-4043-24 TaxID=3421646 RepID=UPI00403AE008
MIRKKLEDIKRVSAIPNYPALCLKAKLFSLLKSYHHSSIEILPDEFCIKFHRSRMVQEKPMLVSELSYPPAESVKLQRANQNQKPVFYCSGDPRASLLELGLRPGDNVVLSKWLLVKSILVFPLGYSAQIFSILGADRKCPDFFPEEFKNHNEQTKSNILLTEFIFYKFTEKGDNLTYKISATIADFFYEAQKECGIVYPSIEMSANAENFAFTTELVDNCLKPLSVKSFKVKDIQDQLYTLSPLDYADSFTANGEIIWKGSVPDEEIKTL